MIFHCKIFSRSAYNLVDSTITSNYTIFEKVGSIGVVLSIRVLMGETLRYIRVLAHGKIGINNN
jgi:hypothetical protein